MDNQTMDNQTVAALFPNNQRGEPLLQIIETGEIATFNDHAMAILFHLTIFYLLALVSIAARSYKEIYQNDEDAIEDDPIVKMIDGIMKAVKLIPMLLVLLIFTVLRAKIVRAISFVKKNNAGYISHFFYFPTFCHPLLLLLFFIYLIKITGFGKLKATGLRTRSCNSNGLHNTFASLHGCFSIPLSGRNEKQTEQRGRGENANKKGNSRVLFACFWNHAAVCFHDVYCCHLCWNI